MKANKALKSSDSWAASVEIVSTSSLPKAMPEHPLEPVVRHAGNLKSDGFPTI